MKTVLSLLLGVLLFTACGQTKTSSLSSFKDFVENVKENSENYTAEDWKKINAKYDEYTAAFDEKFNKDFTDAEKAEVTKLKSMFATIQLKSKVNKVKDNVKDTFKEMEEQSGSWAEGVKEGTN